MGGWRQGMVFYVILLRTNVRKLNSLHLHKYVISIKYVWCLFVVDSNSYLCNVHT